MRCGHWPYRRCGGTVAQQVHGVLAQGVFRAAELFESFDGFFEIGGLIVGVGKLVNVLLADFFRVLVIFFEVREGFGVFFLFEVSLANELFQFSVVIEVAFADERFGVFDELVALALEVVDLRDVIGHHGSVLRVLLHALEAGEGVCVLFVVIGDEAVVVIGRDVVLVLDFFDGSEEGLRFGEIFQVEVAIGQFEFGIGDLFVGEVIDGCLFVKGIASWSLLRWK